MSTYLGQLRAGSIVSIGSPPTHVVDHDSAPFALPLLLVPAATRAIADLRPDSWLSFPITPSGHEGAGDGNAIV